MLARFYIRKHHKRQGATLFSWVVDQANTSNSHTHTHTHHSYTSASKWTSASRAFRILIQRNLSVFLYIIRGTLTMREKNHVKWFTSQCRKKLEHETIRTYIPRAREALYLSLKINDYILDKWWRWWWSETRQSAGRASVTVARARVDTYLDD